MFEAHVLYLLRQYLGEYVRGLSAEALKISVWKGELLVQFLPLLVKLRTSLVFYLFQMDVINQENLRIGSWCMFVFNIVCSNHGTFGQT
ncbi:hypothetical protein O6H91_Y052500 [Diphasiastrum complanatum]|nr:hypothetical protein O6H91_Y052500 [Diphasiastrum complanatum]